MAIKLKCNSLRIHFCWRSVSSLGLCCVFSAPTAAILQERSIQCACWTKISRQLPHSSFHEGQNSTTRGGNESVFVFFNHTFSVSYVTDYTFAYMASYALICCKHQWLLLLFRLHGRLKGLQMELLTKRKSFGQFCLIIVHSASLVWGFYVVICLQKSPLRTRKILQECFTCKVLRKMIEDKLSDVYIYIYI